MAWTTVTAVGLTLALTPLMRVLAVRADIVDRPSTRKNHTQTTALLGGGAVYAAVTGTVLLFAGPVPQALGFLVGGLLFLAIGLADDLLDIGTVKLGVEFVAAWLIVQVTGVTFHLPWPAAGTVLTVFWIVGVVNAFNCLDCADGTASVTAGVGAAAFLIIAAMTGQRLEALLTAAIVGACLGFLPYNIAPARIFLGDAGSLVLGAFVAIVGVMLSPGMISVPFMVAPAVVLAIPIYDIVLVHVMRYRHGTRGLRALLTSTGHDHLPHRLLRCGYTPRQVPLILLLASVATGTAGIAFAAVSSPLAAVIGVAVLGTIAFLDRGMETMVSARRVLPPPGLQKSEAN